MKTTHHHTNDTHHPQWTARFMRSVFRVSIGLLSILLVIGARLPLAAQEAPGGGVVALPAAGPAPAASAVATNGSGGSAAAATPAVPAGPRTLVLENTDLRTLLNSMAREAKMSLILPDDVRGTVTARLIGLDTRRAMEIILESRGYSLEESKDGIFTVKSSASIAQEPLKMEIYQLANTTVEEAQPTVTRLISRAGNVQSDARSNTLIITDTATNLAKILAIIEKLDKATPQVLIESRLLETEVNPSMNIGVRWPDSYTSRLTPNSALIVEKSGQGGGLGFEMQRTATTQVQGLGPGTAAGSASPLGILTGSVPAVAVMTLPQLSATLNLLLSNSETTLLGNPKVITVDNRRAVIRIATQEPIPSFGFNTTTATFGINGFEYRDVGNTLTVTPHVNRDNFITLDVAPVVSDLGTFATFPLNGAGGTASIPRINLRTLDTRVTLQSGHTLALGGLLTEDTTRSHNKVPFLGDIPLLGELFVNRSFSKIKRNLLIFITPTIIPPDGATGLEDQYSEIKNFTEDDQYASRKNFVGNAIPMDQF